MTFDYEEAELILNYLLHNENIKIGGRGGITKKAIRELWDAYSHEEDGDLSEDDENAIVRTFLNNDSIIDDVTPLIIKTNKKCILKSIERDIKSINDIVIEDINNDVPYDYYNEDFDNDNGIPSYAINKFIEELDKQKYFLTWQSPNFARSNFKVIMKSLDYDIETIDYVLFDNLTEEEKHIIVQKLIDANYSLDKYDSEELRSIPELILCAMKKDVNNYRLATGEARKDPELFKYALDHGFKFDSAQLSRVSLSLFTDLNIMDLLLKTESDDSSYFYSNFANKAEARKYINREAKLFSNALKKAPTINQFNEVFDFFAEKSWDSHRMRHANNYANLFGRICATLRHSKTYDQVEDEIRGNIFSVLGPKDSFELKNSMMEYFDIVHSNKSDKKIDTCRDKIAKLVGLYIAKSKEEFKKDIIKDKQSRLKEFCELKKDNPVVIKKATEVAQKDTFKKLLRSGTKEIVDFVKSVEDKYAADFSGMDIVSITEEFLFKNYSDLSYFLEPPRMYKDYNRFKEACKLINRLNSKFIKYTDLELTNYRDIIYYDEGKDEYVYAGPIISNRDTEKCIEYRKLELIFEKLKQDFIFKIKTVTPDEKEIEAVLRDTQFRRSFKFTDEFFEFDLNGVLEELSAGAFTERCIPYRGDLNSESMNNDDNYKALTTLYSETPYIWVGLLGFCGREHMLNDNEYFNIINNIDGIKDLALGSDCNYSSIGDVYNLSKLVEYAGPEELAVLGKDVIFKLCKNLIHTSSRPGVIVDKAYALVSHMVLRNESTVPYIKGETENYKYSLYDSQDVTALLAGINTDACFKVDGIDNDFLHYCLLDKNGFIIKIEDKEGNFVGRAGGFRNGNCIFINQLRTIFDEGGRGYVGRSSFELNDLIQTFYKACEDFVEISHNNPDEKVKIDHVFVTQSYSLVNEKREVSRKVENKIGDYPMVNGGSDWRDFCDKYKDMFRDNDIFGFTTDYGNYDILCAASIKNSIESILPSDIRKRDVKPVYKRTRNDIIVTDKLTDDIINRIEKIRSISAYHTDTDYDRESFFENTYVFLGDNWYFTINFKYNCISGLVLADPESKEEYKNVLLAVKKIYVDSLIDKDPLDKFVKKLKLELPNNYMLNSNN